VTVLAYVLPRKSPGSSRPRRQAGLVVAERVRQLVQLAAIGVRLLVRVETPPRGLVPERVADVFADIAGQLATVAVVPERDRQVRRHVAQNRE